MPPGVTVVAPTSVPSEAALLNRSVPWLTVTGPVKVPAVESCIVPLPVLVMPPVPPTAPRVRRTCGNVGVNDCAVAAASSTSRTALPPVSVVAPKVRPDVPVAVNSFRRTGRVSPSSRLSVPRVCIVPAPIEAGPTSTVTSPPSSVAVL